MTVVHHAIRTSRCLAKELSTINVCTIKVYTISMLLGMCSTLIAHVQAPCAWGVSSTQDSWEAHVGAYRLDAKLVDA